MARLTYVTCVKCTANMDNRILRSCFQLLIRPLMRFALRHNFKIQDVVELCKGELVQAAKNDLKQRGESITASRLSIMTGLQRRDLARFEDKDEFQKAPSLIQKILGHWMTAKRYRQASGHPRALTRDEFYSLVSSVSKDLNPRTVLGELLRIESAKLEGDMVHAIRASVVPRGDVKGGFQIAANDITDLLGAVNTNLLGDPSKMPNHHLRTEFDRIRTDALPEIQAWLLAQGKEFHVKVRQYLSQFDQDINPQENWIGKGSRVAISSFAVNEQEGQEI